ncbi:hypothetical protein D3C76_1518940 [compost metagenome]
MLTKVFERCHDQLWFCTNFLIFICEVEVSHVDTREPFRELFQPVSPGTALFEDVATGKAPGARLY